MNRSINFYPSIFILFCLFSCKTDIELTPNSFQNKSKNLRVAAPIVYNEGLATILRGVRFNFFNGQLLGAPAGYYHIREFRVWNAPEKRAIVFSILKNYGEMANGNSTLPNSSEKWVFYKNYSETIANGGAIRTFIATDSFDKTMKLILTFDAIKQCWNTEAYVNGIVVGASAQTYLGQSLNTCGFLEPAWTVVN